MQGFDLSTLPVMIAAVDAPARSPGWVMILFAIGMLLTYVGVAAERFHMTLAAFCGAVVLVVLALAPGVLDSYEDIYGIPMT